MAAARKTAQTKPAAPVGDPGDPQSTPASPAAVDPAPGADAAGDAPAPPLADDRGDTPAAPPLSKSDLQEVEQPCAQCFPNGWPEGAFSVGCEHGTWIRN